MPEPTLAERLDRLERFFDENRESLEDDGDRRGADILAVLLTDIQEVRKRCERLEGELDLLYQVAENVRHNGKSVNPDAVGLADYVVRSIGDLRAALEVPNDAQTS